MVYYAIKGECPRTYLKKFIRRENVNITPEDITQTHKVLTDFTKEFYNNSPGYATTILELYEIPEFTLPVSDLYRKFKEEFTLPKFTLPKFTLPGFAKQGFTKQGFVWNLALQGNERLINDLLNYGRVDASELIKYYKYNSRIIKVILTRRPDLIHFSDQILENALNHLNKDDIELYNFLKPRVSADIAIWCLLKPLTREKRYIETCMMDTEPVEPFEYWTEVSEDIEEYRIRFELFKELLGTLKSSSINASDGKNEVFKVFEFLVENDLAGMLAYFRSAIPGLVYNREAMLALASKKECEHVVKLI